MIPAREGRQQQRYEHADCNGPTVSSSTAPVRLVAGCVPMVRRQGEDQVVMISSSKGRGWVLPKGGWENDETSEEAAAREAYEEAGVRGTIGATLGTYTSEGRSGRVKTVMYLLEVSELMDLWPEQEKRQRRLASLEEAADMLVRPEQREVVSKLRDAAQQHPHQHPPQPQPFPTA